MTCCDATASITRPPFYRAKSAPAPGFSGLTIQASFVGKSPEHPDRSGINHGLHELELTSSGAIRTIVGLEKFLFSEQALFHYRFRFSERLKKITEVIHQNVLDLTRLRCTSRFQAALLKGFYKVNG